MPVKWNHFAPLSIFAQSKSPRFASAIDEPARSYTTLDARCDAPFSAK